MRTIKGYRKIEPLKSWSFSRYLDYDQCPFKAKCKHVDRIKEPSSPPLERGIEIHDEAKGYLRGHIAHLPKSLTRFKKLFNDLRKLVKNPEIIAYVETTWAFRKDWSVTEWNDWVNCWLRVKLDCGVFHPNSGVLEIFDWKTGKFRIEDSKLQYTMQLELYGLAALKLLPDVKKVEAHLVYLDTGDTFDIAFSRADEKPLEKAWSKRIKQMLIDTRFKATPNYRCTWCYFRKENKCNGGGQCQY